MNIPDKILAKGGSHLDRYVKAKRELEATQSDINEIENNVEDAFTDIEKLIGGYFQKGKSPHDYEYYFRDIHAKKNGTSFLRDIDPLQNIYVAEEILKKIRELTLDERAARIRESELEHEIGKLMGK